MSESLAVKYRPKEFSEVCSQESIIKILTKQLEVGQFSGAYLFAGTSGSGKTTIARILANKINQNCGSPIEIDGASNNGVDNIKDIIQQSRERSLDSIYKVFIIDECHALTSQAWQAFLKCLEEPPKYTVFIFCTTDPQKIPSTIISRVQRFNFTRIKAEVIYSRLKYICDCEGFTNYADGIEYISRIADGGMRTAISYLDKVSSYSKDITIDNVLNALGNYSYKVFFNLLYAILTKNEGVALKTIADFYNDGNDLKSFVEQFLNFIMDVEKYRIFSDIATTRIPKTMEDSLKYVCGVENTAQKFDYYLENILSLKNLIKNDASPRSVIEVTLLKLSRFEV